VQSTAVIGKVVSTGINNRTDDARPWPMPVKGSRPGVYNLRFGHSFFGSGARTRASKQIHLDP